MNDIPERILRLEADIDFRLTDLWAELFAQEYTQAQQEIIALFMRAAYGRGYEDALTDDPPGKLYNDNGYRRPIPE